MTVTENYPLHLGAETPGDGRVVGGITETELHAKICPPSSLPTAPQISTYMHGTSCNIRHLNISQALGQLAPPSSQESSSSPLCTTPASSLPRHRRRRALLPIDAARPLLCRLAALGHPRRSSPAPAAAGEARSTSLVDSIGGLGLGRAGPGRP
eukprot:CAMPEP_0172179324 /NCGR_PEP_ID=MMETSP1050-20130122/16553_1 /TAXON_ID=233186 /ORGANISM="Cryptomonas curvata, Strain CCAP979/52" /LENGTH=153 /DNA_ID=CAMNT_0012852191 /DNA_START=271 /DNA_END=729 /DNA_ORIENTATION=-